MFYKFRQCDEEEKWRMTKMDAILHVYITITACFTDITYHCINTFITQYNIIKQKNYKTCYLCV